MIIESLWIIRLFLSHLITDFILQPTHWIEDRNKNHFHSKKLYLHGAITGLSALIFAGWKYWLPVLIIMITHILIDGWKSYQKEKISFFLLDQFLHIAVIAGCWYITFLNLDLVESIGRRKSCQCR